MQIKNNYKTEDFYLAAFLVASSEELVAHQRQNGLTSFFFDSSESIKQLVANYYELRASINPVLFGTAIRNLKSVIHTDNVLSNQNRNNVEQFKRNS